MRALSYFRDRGEEAAAGLHSLATHCGGPRVEGGKTARPQLSRAEADTGARLCRAAAVEDLLLWLASYEVGFASQCCAKDWVNDSCNNVFVNSHLHVVHTVFYVQGT